MTAFVSGRQAKQLSGPHPGLRNTASGDDGDDGPVSQLAADGSPRIHVRVFPGRPDQIREARRFLARVLDGCPAADDAVLCLSELASNCVLHSASRLPGGTFTLTVEIRECSYVKIELHDNGGPWNQHPNSDDRPHGLQIVASLAAQSGTSGDAITGWVGWALLAWPRTDRA